MHATTLMLALILYAGQPKVDPPPPAKVLAGWPVVYPDLSNFNRTFLQPTVGKEAWSQSIRYEWMGGRLETLELRLARNPEFATRYSEAAYKKLAVTPEKVKVGSFNAWLWPAERLVIILAKDRVAELTSPTIKHHKSDLVSYAEKMPLDELAKAVTKPPRQKFDRTVEAFAALRLGMSLSDVAAWVGDADKDIGSGIHIMAYALPDGTQVLVGFPDFRKLIYVKHKDKNGKVMDLVK